MKRIIPAALVLCALGLAATGPAFAGPSPHPAPAASAAKKKKKKPVTQIVKIADNYYYQPKNSTAPLVVKLHAGDSIKWVWPSDVGDTHDVNLGSGPKGLKPWASPAYAARADFKKQFTKTGTYQLYCSFHQGEMVMTVKVTK